MKVNKLELTLHDISPFIGIDILHDAVSAYLTENYKPSKFPFKLTICKEDGKIVVERFSPCIGESIIDMSFEALEGKGKKPTLQDKLEPQDCGGRSLADILHHLEE